MDNSEIYIKMCEKAEEIQKGWEPQVGDWFLHDWHGTTKMGKELEDKFWPQREKWEKIECLTYKPSIDDYIEVSEVDGTRGIYTSSELLKDRHIWLPRQDQLQEMINRGSKEFFPYNLLWRLYRAISTDAKGDIYNPEFTSMEQLWLAFVMKEKYEKVWNGENWFSAKGKE